MRERLTGIVVKYKQKNEDELNASGISPEHTSLDEALEEISEKMEEADKLHNQTTQENAKNVQEDALKVQEMRQLALETLAETTKQKSEEPKSETKKKSRSSGSETLVYLRQKAEKDQELKLIEMLLRHREELELRKKEIENSKQQQNQMFEYLQTQNSQLFLLLASRIQNEQQPK